MTRRARIEIALGFAADYAQPENVAKRVEIGDAIDELVGEFICRDGLRVMVWPAEVCERAQLPLCAARRPLSIDEAA